MLVFVIVVKTVIRPQSRAIYQSDCRIAGGLFAIDPRCGWSMGYRPPVLQIPVQKLQLSNLFSMLVMSKQCNLEKNFFCAHEAMEKAGLVL